MDKRQAKMLAEQAVNELADRPFNNPIEDVGFDLYTFDLDEETFNVFAYIGKQEDENGVRWYSVYAGVEYGNGDNIYADYEHSTANLDTEELANELYELANMYQDSDNLEDLRDMIK